MLVRCTRCPLTSTVLLSTFRRIAPTSMIAGGSVAQAATAFRSGSIPNLHPAKRSGGQHHVTPPLGFPATRTAWLDPRSSAVPRKSTRARKYRSGQAAETTQRRNLEWLRSPQEPSSPTGGEAFRRPRPRPACGSGARRGRVEAVGGRRRSAAVSRSICRQLRRARSPCAAGGSIYGGG
jgi:hypothetical protein